MIFNTTVEIVKATTIATIGGILAYYREFKDESIPFNICELGIFIITAVYFSYIVSYFIPKSMLSMEYGIIGITGLAANEVVRYFTKDGIVEILKRLTNIFLKKMGGWKYV